MKSVFEKLAHAYDKLEERGKKAEVIEIRESGHSWERKLALAERALGSVRQSSEQRLAESARRAFNWLTPEQARVFAQRHPTDPFWEQIKNMD